MIRINPKRHFAGKPLGTYDPTQDAFVKFKGALPPSPAPTGRIDWSGLDLKLVETMVPYNAGMTVWDALAKARQEGKIIIPNSVHDRMLVGTEHWKNDAIKAGYTAWTGTAIIYEAPDTLFGETVTFRWQVEQGSGRAKRTVDYALTFTVPERFRGKANGALLIDHPDFGIVSTGTASYALQPTEGAAITLVENFPTLSQKWYHFDENTRVPVGAPLGVAAPDDTMRCLWRNAGAYCGLLARAYVVDGGQRDVFADFGPSGAVGVHAVPLGAVMGKE